MELLLKSGNTIKATAKEGVKDAPWHPSGNHYKINVSFNGKRFSFDFWDSYAAMRAGDECDVRGALACWSGDVMSGMTALSADDIAEEFGYTKPSEALKVFKGLKKAEKQYNRIGMTEEDLQELSDY